MADTIRCSACDGKAPRGSRFCPHCGVSISNEGTVEMLSRRPSAAAVRPLRPAAQRRRPRINVDHADRQPLGAPPAGLLLALTAAALIAAGILIVAGAWIGVVISLGVFLAALSMLSSAIRQDPATPAARMRRRTATNTTGTARFAAVSARAWARAVASLVAIKQRRLRLRRELHRQLTPLGEADHQGDEERAEQLKAHAQELERELDESGRQAEAVISGAKAVVGREKSAVERTQAVSLTELDSDDT